MLDVYYMYEIRKISSNEIFETMGKALISVNLRTHFEDPESLIKELEKAFSSNDWRLECDTLESIWKKVNNVSNTIDGYFLNQIRNYRRMMSDWVAVHSLIEQIHFNYTFYSGLNSHPRKIQKAYLTGLDQEKAEKILLDIEEDDFFWIDSSVEAEKRAIITNAIADARALIFLQLPG